MAKTTAEIRPEVEAYVRTHYTTTEDISCGRCGRDQQECTIYFGPTFIGTLQGRRPNYDPMCWEDAVEFEMNARADSGEWDPDLEDADVDQLLTDDGIYQCAVCGDVYPAGQPCHADDCDSCGAFPAYADSPSDPNSPYHCADCLTDPNAADEAAYDERPDGTYTGGWVGGEPPADTEAAAELLEGEPNMIEARERAMGYIPCPRCGGWVLPQQPGDLDYTPDGIHYVGYDADGSLGMRDLDWLCTPTGRVVGHAAIVAYDAACSTKE